MTALLAAPETSPSPAEIVRDDPLFQLQIRVARRADELARKMVSSREADLKSWHQAEREVLEAEVRTMTPDRTAA